MIKCAIFGDSVLRGLYREPDGHRKLWDQKYWINKIMEDCGVMVTNHSQIGNTVERGRMQFEKALNNGMKADYVLLEYGGNDSDFEWAQVVEAPDAAHVSHTPLPVFEQAYGQFIRRVRELEMEPVAVIPAPIDGRRYLDFLGSAYDKQTIADWLQDTTAMYRHVELYAFTVVKLAMQYGCAVLDIRTPFLGRKDLPQLLSMDGLHYLPESYDIIWQQIYDFFANGSKSEW